MRKVQDSYYVKAIWDPEAACFYSESDVPGLVLETKTIEEFEEAMMHFVPQLFAENVLGENPAHLDLPSFIPSLPPVEYRRPVFVMS